MFAVRRGSMNVIQVQSIRDRFAKLALELIGSGDLGKLDLNWSQCGGGNGQGKTPFKRAQSGDQQHRGPA